MNEKLTANRDKYIENSGKCTHKNKESFFHRHYESYFLSSVENEEMRDGKMVFCGKENAHNFNDIP